MRWQIKTLFSVRASQNFGGMAVFLKYSYFQWKGFSKCLKVYYQSFQIVSFRTVCDIRHHMHVAAAADGDLLLFHIVIWLLLLG